MKIYIAPILSLVMMFAVAFLISDLGYSYISALFISSTFLPTVLLSYILLKNFKLSKDLSSVVGFISMIAGLYLLQLLFLALSNYTLHRIEYERVNVPELLTNPIFITIIFALYSLPLLTLRFIKKGAKDEEGRTVEFTSNRKRVKLLISEITYVESRDTEVFLHCIGGEELASRTNITSWSEELGKGFVRIHRAFLVNSRHIQHVTQSEVILFSGERLSISRTYRQRVENLDDMLLER